MSNMMRQERLRFSVENDLQLLREVRENNPFDQYHNWKTINEKLVLVSGKPFSLRSIKEHINHLLKLYKDNAANLRKGGTLEQFKEKQKLLQEIYEMKVNKDIKCKSSVKNKLVQEDISNIKKLYQNDNNTNTLKEELINSSHEGSIVEGCSNNKVESAVCYSTNEDNLQSDRNNSISTLQQTDSNPMFQIMEFIQNKTSAKIDLENKQVEMEERRLVLEERRLALEEEKFKLEKIERTKKLDLDIKEREVHFKLIEQQQQILSFLLDQLIKK